MHIICAKTNILTYYLLADVCRLAAYDLATPAMIPRPAAAPMAPVVLQPVMM